MGMIPDKTNMGDLLHSGLDHHQAGRVRQAEQVYRRILAVEPDNVDANHLLGLLAYQVGKFAIAVNLISRAVKLAPREQVFINNLGNALKANGSLGEAVVCYKKALVLKPDYSDAHYNLGNAYMDLGQPADAVNSYKQATALEPDFAEAHYNLGNACREIGKSEDAVASYQRAVSLKTDFADAYYNLGNVFMEMGQLTRAMESFRKALLIRPEYFEAYNNLGRALRDSGNLDEANGCYRKALAINPEYVESLNNLASGLSDKRDLSGAIAIYYKAIGIEPGRAETYSNLGYTLHEAGRLSEALEILYKAIAIKPDYNHAYSNLLFALNYDFDTTQEEIYTKSLDWGSALLQNLGEDVHAFPNNLDKSRRLRIGYLSPDFRTHSVAYFFEPVLKAHDRGTVEIFCYANVKKQDETTLRLQAESDHWRLIAWKSDAEVVAQIRKDSIDILVDLAGHTGENRLPVFARRPAPVQVSWLGYPNTTGLSTIDYRLTDAVADPAGDADRVHSEKLIRLEHGFLCYQPDASTPGVTGLPSLTQGHITFGSFNNLAKVRPEVIKAWAAILHAVPGSHLLLKAKQLRDNEIRDRYLNMFTAEGIAADRIELLGMLPRKEDHLNLYNRIDIGLDPFPYNGTTTTCEALWMGVPVVTIQGDRHGGRVGASVLHRVGLEELVAVSAEEYIRIACTLAADRQQLQALRVGLRQQLQESELMDSESFTRHLEDIYRQVLAKVDPEKYIKMSGCVSARHTYY